MENMTTLAERYNRDGYVFPIDVVNESEAQAALNDLENAEAKLADDSHKLALLASYPDRVLPSFDRLIRNPNLVAAVSEILGPDLLVWSAGLFSKDPGSEKIVSWHQDLTYWGLDDVDEITAWFALSPSEIDSGCMYFVPGSHKRAQVAHIDTFDENNLLTRGQEIAQPVATENAVPVVLHSGQASLHHGHLFHRSGPNRSEYRRVGAAIRYIKPSMRQRSGDRPLAALVNGEDKFGNFTIADSPSSRLADDDFAQCSRDMEIKRRVLYDGATSNDGPRY